MVSPSTLRRLALALPEATEQDHHGIPSWRVRGRIFASLPDDHHAHLMLSEDAIRDTAAMDPTVFEERWWGARLAALRVRLQEVPEEVLHALLTDAWRRRAPATVSRQRPPGPG